MICWREFVYRSVGRNPLDRVLSSAAEPTRTQSDGFIVQFGSISSIEFDWLGNRTHTKFGVRFGSIAKLNRTQSTDWVRSVGFDWVWLSSIDYAGHTRLYNFARNISTNISTLAQRTHLLLYLSYMISQFLDFLHCIAFDFISYCVAMHTLYHECHTYLRMVKGVFVIRSWFVNGNLFSREMWNGFFSSWIVISLGAVNPDLPK